MKFRLPGAGRSLLLPALSCALVPTAAHGQWSVEAAAGRAVYDPVSAELGTVNASLGLRYHGAGRWMYLSGGTDLGSQGLLWGSGGTGSRLGVARRNGWDLGIDLGAHGYGFTGYSYPADVGGMTVVVREPGDWGVVLEAAPALSLRRDRVGVELRSGVVTSMGPSEGEFLAVSAFDGGVAATWTPRSGVQLGTTGRYMHFPEGGYPYLGGSAQLSRGRGTIWGHAGRWLSDGLPGPRTGYGIGVSLAPHPGLQVTAGWQMETSDPLYLSTPRRTWSVKVSRTLGSPAPALARLSPPRDAEDGTTAIRLPVALAATPPSVLGDFTGWKPVPMVRVGEFWEVRLRIPPGIHHYGFQDGRGGWFLPDYLPAADDGMGGKSAILVVP